MLNDILFVTDNCEYTKEYSIRNKDSEGNRAFSRDEMIKALSQIANKINVTYSLSEVNKYIQENKNTFVVSTYYGIASSDSKSTIPAICSANNIGYWGADAYAHMICNDKYLSKTYIKNFGLTPVPGKIIYSPDALTTFSTLKELRKPLIVKPNFGGGSNGISNKSLTFDDQETLWLIKELHKYQEMPILVEEYIPGYEVSVIIIGNKNEILFCEESELVLQNKNYFEKELFGLEHKKINPENKSYRKSTHIDNKTKNQMLDLFRSFNKMEFMRIDCRVNDSGEIFVLELSPDCYVGTKGAFYETVNRSGLSFDDMIKMMIDNSINNQNHLLSNAP